MALDSFFNSIAIVPQSRSYYFVRTDGGQFFEEYLNNSYIGIGWNHVTKNDLSEMTKAGLEIKNKIEKNHEPLEDDKKPSKAQITGIFTKLLRFKNLKSGDLIIIPSRESSRLAFGIIQDEQIYNQINQVDKCPYIKRRKVKWLEVKNVSELDNIYVKIIKSRHAISDVKNYASYIDSVTEDLYIAGSYTHFVINVNTYDDINLLQLRSFFDTIDDLTKTINKHFQFNENIEDISIKLNLQSPGKIILRLNNQTFTNQSIGKIGKTLSVLALLVSSCANDKKAVDLSASSPELSTFSTLYDKKINDLDKEIEILKIKSRQLQTQ